MKPDVEQGISPVAASDVSGATEFVARPKVLAERYLDSLAGLPATPQGWTTHSLAELGTSVFAAQMLAAATGDPFDQSAALCTAMKAQNVVVYTVGFSIAPGGNAARILSDCATSPQHAFLPASGGDLSEAFAAIGRDITNLRISK